MAKKASITVVEVSEMDMGMDAKLADPAMTTKDNPYASSMNPTVPNPQIIEHNMERLMKDARMRRCHTNGAIYSAIMDNRYGG